MVWVMLSFAYITTYKKMPVHYVNVYYVNYVNLSALRNQKGLRLGDARGTCGSPTCCGVCRAMIHVHAV